MCAFLFWDQTQGKKIASMWHFSLFFPPRACKEEEGEKDGGEGEDRVGSGEEVERDSCRNHEGAS